MKLSIVIPAYNCEKYISKAINSILNQTYCDYEILVVDDGSKDSTKDILLKEASRDSRIKYIYKENGGASTARNLGLKEAKGEYVTFMDADDWWENDELDGMMKILEKDSTIDMLVHFIRKYFEKNSTYTNYQASSLKDKCINVEKDGYNMMREGIFVATANNKIIKKSIIMDNDLFFEPGTVAEDIDWGLRLYEVVNKLYIYGKGMYVYNIHEGSVTSTYNEMKFRQFWAIIKKWIEKTNTLHKDLQKVFFSYLAYQYGIILASYKLHIDKKDDLLREEIYSYKYVLKFACNKKSKIIYALYKFIGIDLTATILSFYLKNR